MSRVTLFSANWCSMCKTVKRKLDDMDINYEVIDVDTREGWDLAEKNRVTSLPTLKATNKYGSDVTYSGYVNYNSLKEFLDEPARAE